MKLKYEFSVREIAGEVVLVPLGEAALKLSGLITTNEVGAFLIENLREDTTQERLVQAVCEDFDIAPETAAADVDSFLARLREFDMLE
ncbi:MAG TPA: PqqD family protein [Candidatus Butyricicoccus stercorigallinarum]|nr:PqqD family protein [Candidatus Butyricicoccus stercorigallinarum]